MRAILISRSVNILESATACPSKATRAVFKGSTRTNARFVDSRSRRHCKAAMLAPLAPSALNSSQIKGLAQPFAPALHTLCSLSTSELLSRSPGALAYGQGLMAHATLQAPCGCRVGSGACCRFVRGATMSSLRQERLPPPGTLDTVTRMCGRLALGSSAARRLAKAAHSNAAGETCKLDSSVAFACRKDGQELPASRIKGAGRTSIAWHPRPANNKRLHQ